MIPNPQSPIPNPQSDDWLPIDHAAQLTGLSERHWRRLAGRLFHRSLARRAAPPAGRGKSIWWISRAAHPQLGAAPARNDPPGDALLAKYPQAHVERAHRRHYWLQQWRNRCERPRITGQTDEQRAVAVVAEAKRLESETFKISVRSLQIWRRAFDAHGIEGLVDRYCPPNSDGATDNRSPEAVDYFRSVYHSQARHSVRTCHAATLARARKRAWSWPVTYGATLRWLRRTEDRSETCLYREGRTAYSKRYLAHLQIDYTVLEPGERYVLDHTQCDFWCRHGEEIIRPWISSIIDARSRLVVGCHLTPVAHQDSILAAMRGAFRDWAVPKRVHIDRGKDFTSKLLTGHTKRERNRLRRQLGPDWRKIVAQQQDTFWLGVLGELGVDIAEAIPYSPWSKGLKERWYRTIQDLLSKTFVTYCGNTAATKPEHLNKLLAKGGADEIPTFAVVRDRLADHVELYNRTEHSGLDGLAPITVWGTASHLRKAVDDQLLALMSARGVYRVHANGVSFRIRSRVVTYGADSPALARLVGRDVFITLDPDHCECCYAFTVQRDTRRFIGRLEANQRIPANTSVDDLSEAIRRVRRRRKRFEAAAREGPERMRTAAQEVTALRREQLAELRKTGTDDMAPKPNISVVRTGFEGVSTPAQTSVDTRPYCPPEAADFEDLLIGDNHDADSDEETLDVTELLSSEDEIDEAEDDLSVLL